MKSIILTLAALLCAPSQAADSERCHNVAALYQLTYNLTANGLSEEQVAALVKTYPGVSAAERERAVYRVRPGGDLAKTVTTTVYKRVLLQCKAAIKA